MSVSSFIKVIISIMLMVFYGGLNCKPKPPRPAVRGPDGSILEPPEPPKAEDETIAQGLAKEAEQLEAASDIAGAKKKRDIIAEKYPGTEAGAKIILARAIYEEEAGNTEKAITWYERVLFYKPSFEGADAARERYAKLLVQVNRNEDAVNMLRALYVNFKHARDKLRVGPLLAKALFRSNQNDEALKIYVDLFDTGALAGADEEQMRKQADDIVIEHLTFKQAEALWLEVENKSNWEFILPTLAYKLAKIYFHVRKYEASEALLKKVSTRFASSSFGEPARDFLEKFYARFKVDPNTICVLLPLSGRLQQYGERSLSAINLVFEKDKSYKLIVKDTEGIATEADRQLQACVYEDHVIAIIGPLFSPEALAAALKAEELSTPLLTLSHRQGLPQIGEWVFSTALTVNAQARGLAQVAFENLGFKKYALMYPRNHYGNEFINAFWDEVEKRGGEIRAVESYEHNQKTFREPVQKLVGRYYKYARQEYCDKVEEIKLQKLPPHVSRMVIEKLEKKLPPVVDFEAIVIPDSGMNIGLIAPALAVEDVVLTHDPKRLQKIKKAMGREDAEPVTLLGASTWNSVQTLENCEERYCEDAIFVDAFYLDSPDPKVRDFVSAFRQATEIDPHLGEAQAYDTAGLVHWILKANKPKDRRAFQKALWNLKAYQGVTGKIRFDREGEMQKDLIALTIKDRSIQLYEANEDSRRNDKDKRNKNKKNK